MSNQPDLVPIRAPKQTRPTVQRSPLSRLIDAVGSISFGVTMMVLILAYCWIGSAGFTPLTDWFVRQSFEKTEMEWFNWWPFHVLLILFSISLILVTWRRIRFNRFNLGVWTVHSGILVLILGAVVYFGTKVEGDMAVYRRQAILRSGGAEARLLLRPGESTSLSAGSRRYEISVSTLNPGYELLTGEDQGKQTFAAQLLVRPFEDGEPQRPFIRQLLAGYPKYTEDVLPGQGRAVKLVGQPLVDQQLEAELAYAPSDRIFLRESMALHVREEGATEWTELPLKGLPRYHEYVSEGRDVMVMPGETLDRLRRLNLEPRVKHDTEPFDDSLRFRVTGFLPFARSASVWRPGGQAFNPYAKLSIRIGEEMISRELLANDPENSSFSLGDDLLTVGFEWVTDPSKLEDYLRPKQPRVRVEIASRTTEYPLAQVMEAEVAVEGTDYRLKGIELYPRWNLASTGETASMALIEVAGPRGTFRRAVLAPFTELSQDIGEQGMQHGGLIDENIRIELIDVPETGLLVIGGPVGLHGLLTSAGGEVIHRALVTGQPASFVGGSLELTVETISETARRERIPVIVPKRERDMKAGPSYSMVQVEVTRGEWSERHWVEYSHYAHPSIIGFFPQPVTLPDGRRIELLYSRETREMPTAVALEAFRLETYPGQMRERDYISLVRFRQDDGWSGVEEIRSNQPTSHDGWWFFQSTWDPPRPQLGHAGLNYTGLGVGNRNGVLIMLLGSAMTVLGTLYAFYLKPVLIKRHRDAARRSEPLASPTEEERPAAAALGSKGAVARMGESS
ncbi:MAG: hypothetical protein JSV80_12355 [Acidobacteriota bacterium]|nr:MAG: hypothetical protein JSV80_12355 [Acidobacteriota bacterium]